MARLKGLPTLAVTALLFLSPDLARSREAPPTPLGAVVASTLAFAGGWQTIMNRTERYTLVLQINNSMVNPLMSDLYVTGQLINPDAGNVTVGTLQGIIPRGTRTLQFSFAMPGANRGGSGQLILSQDGNSISGSGKAGDAVFTWRGTRAK
jgi:hypothetical protein